MSYSHKLSDIIALGKCEVHYAKKASITFALAKHLEKRAIALLDLKIQT